MTSRKPERATAFIALASIVLTGFVVAAVNVLIFQARARFIAAHPVESERLPPTISAAIGDPAIGVPFAQWMLICAPILFVGVVCLVVASLREAQGDTPALTRVRRLAVLLLLLQAMAAVGMVMLSQFRFPHGRDLHMAGSYLFFFSQAFVIVLGEILSRRMAVLDPDGVMAPGPSRVRRVYVWVPILLGLVYLSLFVGKDFDLGAMKHGVHQTYVIVEPLLISSFLGYVLTYHIDLWGVVWRYVRS